MFKKFLLVIFLIMPLFRLTGSFVLAEEVGMVKEYRSVVLESGDTIDHDFLAAGETVFVFGTVNGDVYVAGGQVRVEGTINGDVLAAGGQVTISGTVHEDVRVVGGQVNIEGLVDGNVSGLAGNLYVSPEAEVRGSVVGAGGNWEINGLVDGQARLASGNVVVNGTVNNNMFIESGQLLLTPAAVLGGDLIYASPEEVRLSGGSQVAGDIVRRDSFWGHLANKSREINREQAMKGVLAFFTAWKIMSFFSLWLIGLIWVGFFPNLAASESRLVQDRFWLSLGVGVALLFGIPLAALALFITLVGIPLGAILITLYAIMLYLAKLPFVMMVGDAVWNRLSKRKIDKKLVFSLGLVVYSLVAWLPLVGGLWQMAALVIGLGAGAIYKRELAVAARKSKQL